MQTNYFLRILLGVIALFLSIRPAVSLSNRVSILLANITNEDIAVAGAEQMCDVSGLPYRVTPFIREAQGAKMILLASPDNLSYLQNTRSDSLYQYVNGGGLLFISGKMLGEKFLLKFGLKSTTAEVSPALHGFMWNKDYTGKEFAWINHPTEWEVPINTERSTDLTYKTQCVYPNDADGLIPLAHYDNGEMAAFKVAIGKGFLYYFGVNMRDLIARQQLRLNSLTRISNNEIDLASEPFLLLPRSIFEANNSVSIVKHTLPADSKGLLIVTHDVDSKTGIDTMAIYADYEASIGYKGHYYVTTSTTKDSRGAGYYTPDKLPLFQELVAKGHTIGSHSVSHFPDMSRKDFEMGHLGQYDRMTYHPVYFDNASVGGTMYGEAEVSKHILEEDLGVKVTTFRAGHLAIHRSMLAVLDTLSYRVSSNVMLREIRSSFPYHQRTLFATSSIPSRMLYEYPLSISDVESGIEPDAFLQEVGRRWAQFMEVSRENHAPTVILIHPNRTLKRNMQQHLIEGLSAGTYLYNMEDFDTYWRSRHAIDYDFEEREGLIRITLARPFGEITSDLSFLATIPDDVSALFVDSEGEELQALVSDFSSSYKLLRFSAQTRIVDPKKVPLNDIDTEEERHPQFEIISMHNTRLLRSVKPSTARCTYRIYSIGGACVGQGVLSPNGSSTITQFARGCYLVKISTPNGTMTLKFIQ